MITVKLVVVLKVKPGGVRGVRDSLGYEKRCGGTYETSSRDYSTAMAHRAA